MASMIIGQYLAGSSPLHRADPRFKLVFALLYLIMVFVAPGFYGLVVMAVFTAVLIALSRIPVKTILRTLVPLLFILVFTVILNLLFTREGSMLWQWGILTVTDAGIYRAIFFPLRILLLLLGMSLLTLTTAPIDLTDGMEALMRPLEKLHVPVHELSMMMGIALRFLPVFMDELVKIKRAQEARGAAFGSGSLLARAKSLIPLMVPLFVSAFRHAESLAMAMESRCYHGGAGRTRMHVLVATRSDYVALTFFFAMLVLACAMRIVFVFMGITF